MELKFFFMVVLLGFCCAIQAAPPPTPSPALPPLQPADSAQGQDEDSHNEASDYPDGHSGSGENWTDGLDGENDNSPGYSARDPSDDRSDACLDCNGEDPAAGTSESNRAEHEREGGHDVK